MNLFHGHPFSYVHEKKADDRNEPIYLLITVVLIYLDMNHSMSTSHMQIDRNGFWTKIHLAKFLQFR